MLDNKKLYARKFESGCRLYSGTLDMFRIKYSVYVMALFFFQKFFDERRGKTQNFGKLVSLNYFLSRKGQARELDRGANVIMLTPAAGSIPPQ